MSHEGAARRYARARLHRRHRRALRHDDARRHGRRGDPPRIAAAVPAHNQRDGYPSGQGACSLNGAGGAGLPGLRPRRAALEPLRSVQLPRPQQAQRHCRSRHAARSRDGQGSDRVERRARREPAGCAGALRAGLRGGAEGAARPYLDVYLRHGGVGPLPRPAGLRRPFREPGRRVLAAGQPEQPPALEYNGRRLRSGVGRRPGVARRGPRPPAGRDGRGSVRRHFHGGSCTYTSSPPPIGTTP